MRVWLLLAVLVTGCDALTAADPACAPIGPLTLKYRGLVWVPEEVGPNPESMLIPPGEIWEITDLQPNHKGAWTEPPMRVWPSWYTADASTHPGKRNMRVLFERTLGVVPAPPGQHYGPGELVLTPGQGILMRLEFAITEPDLEAQLKVDGLRWRESCLDYVRRR